MLHTEVRSASLASRTLHRESIEAFYFKRYLTILYITNLPLSPQPSNSPVTLRYTVLIHKDNEVGGRTFSVNT